MLSRQNLFPLKSNTAGFATTCEETRVFFVCMFVTSYNFETTTRACVSVAPWRHWREEEESRLFSNRDLASFRAPRELVR